MNYYQAINIKYNIKLILKLLVGLYMCHKNPVY